MYRSNLYTFFFNTASSIIPYLWFTKFQVLNNVQEIITIRSFLLIAITLLIGGIPTSYSIHQKNLSKENFYKILFFIFALVIIIYLTNIIFNKNSYAYINIISIFSLLTIGAYELSFGFFKAILKIKINLKASIIRLLSTLIMLYLFSSGILSIDGAANTFLISISSSCILPIVFYLYKLKEVDFPHQSKTKTKKLFKSSIPHYINIFCQSLVANIDRLIIVSSVIPILLIDYDFILLFLGFLYSFTITPLTQLIHPTYMRSKDNIKEGRIIINKLANDLYKTQLKLIFPIIFFIYFLKIFGYVTKINPFTLSIISISIFVQSYIFLSSSTFNFNGKDKIHTYITLINAILYCSLLKLMIDNFGLVGAAMSRLIYFVNALFIGFLINKTMFSTTSIVDFKNQILLPIMKISTVIFLFTYLGITIINNY